MISLRTKDEVTAAASTRLLARASSPRALASLSERAIAGLIYPAGFYRTKARHLRQVGRLLVERGRVPEAMEDLLALPGICVDTHVHRISNRLGWVRTRSPHETEKALMARLPRGYWIPINGLLVAFGQRTCTPQSPRCSGCPIRAHCARMGVTRSR